MQINKLTFTSIEPKTAQQAKEAEITDRNNEYKDPLKDWKIRCLSYSNEIGATINVIAPKLGAALWIPTFMYLGADIYDKYKNDKDIYDPSSRRGLEQVISQSASSILLPAIPILVGQKVTSPIGKIFSDRLSINEKDAVISSINGFIDQVPVEILDNKELYKDKLTQSIKNKINVIKHDMRTDNIFKKVYKFFNGDYALWNIKTERLENFISENTNMLFELKENLEKGIRGNKVPKKTFNQYIIEIAEKEELYGADTTKQALRKALKTYQNNKIFKNKLIKTFGGIIALILLIKPIDNFTQKTLIEKVVDPGINLLHDSITDKKLLKFKTIAQSIKEAEEQPFQNGNNKTEPNNTMTTLPES